MIRYPSWGEYLCFILLKFAVLAWLQSRSNHTRSILMNCHVSLEFFSGMFCLEDLLWYPSVVLGKEYASLQCHLKKKITEVGSLFAVMC